VKDAQNEVERGAPSVIWASTSARNLDVGAVETRKEQISITVKQRDIAVSGKKKGLSCNIWLR
jgi:hypothetical protein